MNDITHFGVKGMRWGVRKNQTEGSSSDRRENLKKAAVILGSAAAATAIIAGTVYVARKNMGNISMVDITPSDTGKNFADSFAQEPVGIVHAARGKHKGFTFPQRGGLDDPVKEYDKANPDSLVLNSYRRYGDRQEKVAAKFSDPLGRKDRAGRPIEHNVILPEDLASRINSFDDIVPTVWPLIDNTYAALYDA